MRVGLGTRIEIFDRLDSHGFGYVQPEPMKIHTKTTWGGVGWGLRVFRFDGFLPTHIQNKCAVHEK
jgi:hypothetical protein